MSKSILQRVDLDGKRHVAILVAIVLLAVFVRVSTFVGYQPSDPSAYANLAAELERGSLLIPGYDGPPVFPLRLGMYVPTALLIDLLGTSNWVFGIYPFALGIGMCVAAYIFGRLAASPTVGLLAAAILAIVPCATVTSLWADFCANVWGACAMLLMACGLRADGGRRAFGLSVLSGALFWLAWIHKESAIALGPIVLAMPWMSSMTRDRHRSVTVLCFTGLTALALLVTELCFFRVRTGDFLFRFHEISRNYEVCRHYFFDPASKTLGWREGEFWSTMLFRWLVTGPRAMLGSKLLTFLPTLALISLITCWWMRHRRGVVWLLSMWVVSLLVFFNFMTVSLQAYRPLPIGAMYVSWLILPSSLAIALAAEAGFGAWKTFRSPAIPVLAAAPLLLVSVGAVYQNVNRVKARDFMPLERLVAKTLDECDVVVTDADTARNLDFYRFQAIVQPSGRCLNWNQIRKSQAAAGTLVLVNRDRLGFLSDMVEYECPAEWRVADDWIEVERVRNAILYRLPDPVAAPSESAVDQVL